MHVFKLIFKNLFRHKLRSMLTIFGMSVAVVAYVLIRTVIGAWYINLDAASPNRLVTRHAVSFIFPLPISYLDRIATVPGVKLVSYATWFQGVYIEQKNFFARIGTDFNTILEVYPEYIVPPDELEAIKKQRNACVVGVKTAAKYKLKIGDVMPVEGDIYPGHWEFVVRGFYRGTMESADETQMFFHQEYLEERLKRDAPSRAGHVGWYVIQIADPSRSADISQKVDAIFKNSPAETKTETEKAFTQGMISMSSAIITAMEFISYIVIGIILLVLANTMVMTARERVTEYAVLKTLGFKTLHIGGLILGESVLISAMGAAIGMLLAIPMVKGVAVQLSTFFPIFVVQTQTIFLGAGFALLIGLLASIVPLYRAMNTTIVEGLRHIG